MINIYKSHIISHMSHVICDMSYVICHMSHVTCHMSHVTCHMSHVLCLHVHTYMYISNIQCKCCKFTFLGVSMFNRRRGGSQVNNTYFYNLSESRDCTAHQGTSTWVLCDFHCTHSFWSFRFFFVVSKMRCLIILKCFVAKKAWYLSETVCIEQPTPFLTEQEIQNRWYN